MMIPPKEFIPHNYQEEAISFGLQKCLFDKTGVAFFHDLGLGKTAVSLSLIKTLRQVSRLRQTIVIAPLRPIYSVWPQEIREWDQFKDLTFRIAHGSVQRRQGALKSNADIILINAEGVHAMVRQVLAASMKLHTVPDVCSLLKQMRLHHLIPELERTGDMEAVLKEVSPSRYATLVKHLQLEIPFGWDNLVIDESTLFKNPDARRFHALRAIAPQFKYRSLLSATPSPNGLGDLWAQIYLLDGGKSLGPSITAFRSRYFNQGFRGYSWNAKPGAEEHVYEAVGPMVHRLKASDHLLLPAMIFNDVWVDLDSDTLARYKQLEREMFIEIDESDTDVIVGNAGAKYASCKGFANGGVYEKLDDESRKTHHIHDDKVKALDEVVTALQGRPLMVAYQFHHDLERIQSHKSFKKSPVINGSISGPQTDDLIKKWNEGKIPVLLVQPQSLSHGVNMQKGGHDIAWFGLTDNLEIYLQFNGRLHRQGVKKTVTIHRILARDTVDEVVRERIENKDASQRSLLAALQLYRKHKALYEDREG